MKFTEPTIRELSEKKLVGLKMSMCFAENKTGLLWRNFMFRQQEIKNVTGTELYSLQKYPPEFFNPFNPQTTFDKWAAVEVADFDMTPDGMESLVLPGGLYAVFVYRGKPSEAGPFFQNIFSTWLPASGYMLDTRHHFEVLGDKYKNDHPDSEEDIWIPLKEKTR